MLSPSPGEVLREAAADRMNRPSPMFNGGHEFGLQHAAATARSGGRFVGFVGRHTMWRPGVVAACAWTGYAWFSQVAAVAVAAPRTVTEYHATCTKLTGALAYQCMPTIGGPGPVVGTSVYDPASAWSWTANAAQLCYLLAAFTTIGAVTVGFLKLATRSTSARPRLGRARPIRGVRADWKAAKRDVKQVNRRLARVGQWRLRRWGRQWAAERGAGMPDGGLTRPGTVDRWLFRRVQPSKKAKRWGQAHRKAERTAKREERATRKRQQVELDAEWKTELARIEANQKARYQPTTRLDPNAGPPVAPAASESPEVVEWRAQARSAESRAAALLAELDQMQYGDGHQADYVPPPAPSTNGSRP